MNVSKLLTKSGGAWNLTKLERMQNILLSQKVLELQMRSWTKAGQDTRFAEPSLSCICILSGSLAGAISLSTSTHLVQGMIGVAHNQNAVAAATEQCIHQQHAGEGLACAWKLRLQHKTYEEEHAVRIQDRSN